MAHLYLDEDIPITLASIMNGAGHPTWTTAGVGRLGRWDAEQLLFAAEQGWTLVTHNRRDYHALHEGWTVWSPRWREPLSHQGILTLDQGHRLRPGDYVQALLALLSSGGVELTNRTYDWRARNGGEWVAWRPLPNEEH